MAETALKTAALLLTSIVTAVVCTEEQCPPWFLLENSTSSSQFPQCVCSELLPYMIKCSQREQTSYLRPGHCAFQHSTTNDTMVAPCPYVFPQPLLEKGLLQLPKKKSDLNTFMCESLNREVGEDTCSKCKNGTGPNVYSAGSECTKCSAWNIVYYLLLQYLPTTILFVLVLLFRISVTSAPMAHYVLFCNGLAMFFNKAPVGLDSIQSLSKSAQKYPFKIFLTLNSIWSFDPLFYVSPALCISPNMEEIYIPFIDILATLYPFSLLLLTYVAIELHARDCRPVVVLWRPLHKIYVRLRRSWDPAVSLIQAFATLFFISYAKLLCLIFVPLLQSNFMNNRGQVLTKVTFIDPTVTVFSQKHLYVISFCSGILFFIIMPPIILLIVYPTRLFEKVKSCLSQRQNLSLFTFVDTFQGCYKNGTNGTHDYRVVSGWLLASFTLLLLLASIFSLLVEVGDKRPLLSWQIPILLLVAVCVLCGVLRPYRSEAANHSGVILPAMLAAAGTMYITFLNSTAYFHTIIVLDCLFLSIPHCVFYGYIVYRIGKQLKQSNIDLRAVARKWCRQSGDEEQPLLREVVD